MIMKKLHCLVLILISTLFPVVIGQAQTKYQTYSNPRFGYEISYPEEFKVQPPSSNDDGRIFLSADKQIEMRVWGEYNALFKTLKGAYEDARAEHTGISYKSLIKKGFVISGASDNKIYYQKTLLKGNERDPGATWITFTIEYPQDERSKYDLIVSHISKSLKFN